MEKILSKSITIKADTKASPEIISLLKNTLWGTPGSTQYKHLDTEKTINDIRSPNFFSLTRHQNLICTVCLAGRKVNIDGEEIATDYVRYLAADSKITRGRKSTSLSVNHRFDGLIKQFVSEVFEFGNQQERLALKDNKTLYFAYVESDNIRSLHMCNGFGFSKVRVLSTLSFSRFSPKTFPGVRKANPSDHEQIIRLLEHEYAHHNFRYFDHLFYKDNYFVFEADGEIVAGVQSNPMHWSFKHLPGFSGKILLKLLPHIPYLRRLINPNKFSFSAMEGVFCKKGHEKALNLLFESVLALQHNYSALLWFDLECPVLKKIKKHCRLGIMDKINSNGDGVVMVKGINLTEKNWQFLNERPTYVSCFDFN